MEQARIAVAVAPGEAAWAVDAIRRGGGEPVGLGEKPSGLVWADPGAVEELGDVLRAYPGISWVQLPMAGIERVALSAEMVNHRRTGALRRVLWRSSD